ncbi:MAG: M20/M25/M40 family metallo-hydrolase [Saprospirales bacterium]|nr:M20/M25/M40 family metallo-hydrolase [Saprospirales bacterium]
MRIAKTILLLPLLLTLYCLALPAQDAPDSTINALIRKHGLEQSRLMETASWLTDVYGPRLTGSLLLDQATAWTLETLKAWGLEQVHTEPWGPFGRGWELQHFEMHVTEPSYFPVLAWPKAWSPSTNGSVSGEVVYLDASSEEDLEKYKGRLKGKFVLLDTLRATSPWFGGTASRLDAGELLDLANAAMPGQGGGRRNTNFRGRSNPFFRQLTDFLYAEQPLALIDRGFKGDQGTVFVQGARAKNGSAYADTAVVLPQVTLSVEQYNRIFRILQKGIPVRISMELKAEFSNTGGMEHNIIAEIPGTDLKDQVVLFGGHFDSWQAGTGATDNAAGSAVMMEAARILLETIKESGVRPRRTLRLALWTGEEQGLLGSAGYVKEHFAEMKDRRVQALKPEQGKVSAYYNLDNGTGKIRGIYLQGNDQAGPVFRPWLDAFKDLGATTISLSNTGGTDHQSFDRAGIPGFQFIQDPIDYDTRTHHSNMDVYDQLIADDLKQAATIIASFIWHTAQRDALLPRKPVVVGDGTAGGK